MINLLPNEVKDERHFGRLNQKLISVSLAILSVALICGGIIAFAWQKVVSEKQLIAAEISNNTVQLAKLDKDRKQIDETAKQLATIKKLYDSEVKFSEIIPNIASVIPPGAILTSLSLTGNKDEPLQLSFKMKNQELASVIRLNLVNSELFQSADILSVSGSSNQDTATSDPNASAYPYSASITVALKGAKPKKAGTAR